MLGRWLDGAEDLTLGGKRHRSSGQFAALPERHMDRPVCAAGLAELPGAIERVDDPYPVRRQPRRVVPALLRQDGVARAAGCELC